MASGVSGYVDIASGSFTVRVHYSETYDIASNSSTITITNAQLASSSYYGWSYYPSGSISVNGTEVVSCSSSLGSHYAYVPAANTFYNITAASSSYSSPPWSGGTITHNDDGTKNITISVSFNIWTLSGGGGSGSNVSGSKTISLTTIPRKSTLSVGNGTLGTAQTLTVTRKHSSFTHTITYSCGSASGTICSKSSSTSISWTPPLSLANQVPNATAALCSLTITTYNGNTNIGSNSYSITLYLPSSIKPSVSISVSDAMGYASTYGGYIKGLSKFKIALTATTSYGSAISAYRITANGSSYSSSSATTGVVTTSGKNTISASVTDKRGRSGSNSTSVTVLDYAAPSITLLKVNRCNSDGTENNQGEYVKVTYSGTVTSLSNKNGVAYTVSYKKTSTTSWTNIADVTGDGVYSVSNATYVFAADSGSSYDVRVTLSDNFNTTYRDAVVSTAFTMMHFNTAGNGMAIGKVSETENVFDVALETKFRNNVNMANDYILKADNASGDARNLATLNRYNDYAFGYGGYQHSEGKTWLYGNNIRLHSRNGTYANNTFTADYIYVNNYIQSSTMNVVTLSNGTNIGTAFKSWKYGVAYYQNNTITVSNAPGGYNSGQYITYYRLTKNMLIANVYIGWLYYCDTTNDTLQGWQLIRSPNSDVVYSKGTSGIWTYRKWESGIAECWCRKSNTISGITKAWGNIYCCDNAMPSVAYPFNFTDNPIILANEHRNSGGNYWLYTNGNTAQSTPFYGVARGSSYSGSFVVTVDFYVVGRWK